MELNELNEHVFVSGQITPEQVTMLKDLGFEMIINNRPDGEADGQPTSESIKKACDDAGIDYLHIPMFGPKFTDEDLEKFKQALDKKAKTFAFCRTGNRSSMIFNAATAG